MLTSGVVAWREISKLYVIAFKAIVDGKIPVDIEPKRYDIGAL